MEFLDMDVMISNLLYVMNHRLLFLLLIVASSANGQNYRRMDKSIPLNIKLGDTVTANRNFKHVKDAGKEGLLASLSPFNFYDAYIYDSSGLNKLFDSPVKKY